MALPEVANNVNVIIAGLRTRSGSAFQVLTLIGTGQFDIYSGTPEKANPLRRNWSQKVRSR
jgi:hypothetical protein